LRVDTTTITKTARPVLPGALGLFGTFRLAASMLPVRVKKTRQNKRGEPGFDSIKAE
jgi:hypothetical protein